LHCIICSRRQRVHLCFPPNHVHSSKLYYIIEIEMVGIQNQTIQKFNLSIKYFFLDRSKNRKLMFLNQWEYNTIYFSIKCSIIILYHFDLSHVIIAAACMHLPNSVCIYSYKSNLIQKSRGVYMNHQKFYDIFRDVNTVINLL